MAQVATTSVPFGPAAGRAYVTLTSWAGDAAFTTTPLATDQIEGPDSLTLNVDGTVAGVDGNYTLRHIVASTGSTEGVSYNIATVTGAGVLSPPTGYGSVTLSGTIQSNSQFTVQPVAGDQIWFPTGTTVDAQLNITGSFGDHVIYHVFADGTAEAIDYSIVAQFVVIESATASNDATFEKIVPISASAVISYIAPADKTAVTLVDPIEPYVFQGWASPPVAGEQLLSTTLEGVFDQNGNWSGNEEGIFNYWFIGADGQVHAHTIDTAGLPEVVTVTTQATIGFGAGNTTTTLADPIDPYLFEQWSRQPVAGEQLTIADTAGSFSVNGELTTETEGLIDVYFTDATGQVFALQVDSTGLQAAAEVYSFPIAINAQANTSAQIDQTLVEVQTFALAEDALVNTNLVILPANYLTPVIPLPPTDLNAGHDSNYQVTEIQLYQGSWHKLIAPINIGGEAITDISRARMQLFRGPDPVLTLTMNDKITFADSTLYIELDETDTVNLIQGYQYEIWVMDLNSNPLFVSSGKIVFKPTQLRF